MGMGNALSDGRNQRSGFYWHVKTSCNTMQGAGNGIGSMVLDQGYLCIYGISRV